MEFSGNQKARIIAVTLAALGANALDARANTKERGDVLPPTHLIDSAPMSGAENDISRLSPERQYCFRIALYDTVLGVDPRYVNGHTTRSMICVPIGMVWGRAVRGK